MTKEQLIIKGWIDEIKQRALENHQGHHRDPDDQFKAGANFAYYDALTILQQDIEGIGWDLNEMGLDENLDQLFYRA